MTGTPLVRKCSTRIALGVRAGVFLAALAVGAPMMGQAARPRPAAPRGFGRPPVQSRPPAQPQYRPQPQQQYRPPVQPQPQGVRPQQGFAQQNQAAPQANRPVAQPAQRPGTTALVNPGHPGQMSQHLGSWMENHGNLSPAQQHQALESEPGFHELQPAEQERLHNQLTKLNNMPPAQRERRIRYDEQMEALTPPQRKQVNGVLGQFGGLPEYRQAAVRRAYIQLRDLPPAQSQALLNSPQYRAQFNDSERATIGNMVNSAPLLRGFEAQGPRAPQQIPHD